MALAADTPRITSPASSTTAQVANTAVAYDGALLAMGTPQHATSASRGRVFPWTGALGEFPLGFCYQGKVTGDTSATPPNATSVWIADTRVNSCPVTGLAGTVADNMKWVYATADGTFTLTRPADPNGEPVGVTIQFQTSALCDVVFFGLGTKMAMSAAGGTKRTWCLGAVKPYRSASGNVMTGIVAPCHGRILSVYAECIAANTDVDVDSDINLEIGGTNVTGGVVELIYTDAAGDKKSGTAVTAANVFHAGDLIDVEVTVNTAGTATDPGLYNLYVEFETLPGL